MKNNIIIYVFLFLWLTVSYNSQFADTTVPFIGFGLNVLLEAALLVLLVPTMLSTHINVYQKWVLVILAFWAASTTWSVNREAMASFVTFSIPYILCYFLSASISTKRNVEQVMKIELIAVFLCAIYVLFFVNTGNLADERLGGSDDDRIWNANDIGMKMTIGYAIGMYLLLKGETNKLLIYGLMALILLVALMSGSRKVIILLVMFTALLMIVRAKRQKKILYAAYAGIFVVVSYLAVMNVPVLYDILGKRIDMVLDGLRGESGGYSMDERTLMIGYGIEFMSGHLWLGNGFNAFSELFGNITGWYTYSHNNFIELLVNTGITGLLLYYSLTFYILKRLWKPTFKDRDTLAQILFLYTFIALFLDYAMVSYVNVPTMFRLMYTARYSQVLKKGEVATVSPKKKLKINASGIKTEGIQ